jgi:hypothetical protein
MRVRDLRTLLLDVPQDAEAKWLTYDRNKKEFVVSVIDEVTPDATGSYVGLSAAPLDELVEAGWLN